MIPAHPSPAPKTRFWITEAARLLLLAAVATWLLHPFATTNLVGAGDALWYTNMLADFVLQLRAGIFPVFVGQTEFAFNGAVYPLRVAPLYQHLAGILDLVTGRQLGFFALQHLCVLVMGYSGIFSCYFCLTQIRSSHRWSAAALAILYLSCPGLLGTIYTQDQYMTWMTVPFVPIAILGLVKSFTEASIGAQLILAAGLAALWLAHAPIALWLTIIAAGLQLVRLLFIHRTKSSWLRAAAGAAAFVALGHYPFVSVATIQLPGATSAVSGTLPRAELIPTNIRESFPAIILPLSDQARALSDLQLGYGLWLVFLAAVTVWFYRRRSPALAGLLFAAGVLLWLLFPMPGNAWAWEHLPTTLTRITYYWPMQRFYLVLAGLLTAGGCLAIAALETHRPQLKTLVAALLVSACGWSLWESRQWVAAGKERTASAAVTAQRMRSENRLLMNHAYGLFSQLPDSFSNGTLDPLNESRLRNQNGDVVQPSAPDKTQQNGELTGTIDENPGILKLSPLLRLDPGLRYKLTLTFTPREYQGILQLVGRTLFREYALPNSGEAAAFGSVLGNTHTLWLWSSDPAGDEVTLKFIPTAPGANPASFAAFGRFTFEAVQPTTAPILTHSVLPYQATVKSPSNTWLQTPRMAARDYHATVDGVPTQTKRAPDGLLWVAVPGGEHFVKVVFVAPIELQLAYWVSLLAWSAITGAVVFARVRRILAISPS